VVKVVGSAWLRFRGVGQLEAETVHFYLDESAPVAGQKQPALRPNRMEASRNVRLRSPQLEGSVEELTVLFGELPPGAAPKRQPGNGTSTRPRRIRSDNGRVVELAPVVARQAAAAAEDPEPVGSTEEAGQDEPADNKEPPEPTTRFEVNGKKLQARVLLGEEATRVAEVCVEGDARFAETQTARPDERPVRIQGDRIHVRDAETPRAAVTIVGKPAQFEGRGMAIQSNHIHVNRGTNRLLIDDAGRMSLPLDRDLDGRPLAAPTRLIIDWRHRMEFDGRAARFEESVVARTPQQSLHTEMLEVQFQQPIHFASADLGAPPQVEEVNCRGGALLESRGGDGPQPTAHERMQALDLTVNLRSGNLTARGPGWLMSLRQASAGSPFGSPRGMPLTPPTPAAENLPLRQLYVRFQGGLTGNVHQRVVSFHDEVRTIYTPVASWDAPVPSDDPQTLGPRGIVMNCNRLSLRQILRPDGSQQTSEFEAAGNTIVESAGYTARAVRMTYSEAKDLLVLEGDGRTDAQLFRQQQIGGPLSKAAAQRILFWPGSNRLKVDGARSLELSQFQTDLPGTR